MGKLYEFIKFRDSVEHPTLEELNRQIEEFEKSERERTIIKNKEEAEKKVKQIAEQELIRINQFLNKYGFEASIEWDWEFDNNALGMFLATEQESSDTFPIALNVERLIENADGNLYFTVESTIAHEVGHGLFYFLNEIYDLDELNPENIAEEFAIDYCHHSLEHNELMHVLEQFMEEE